MPTPYARLVQRIRKKLVDQPLRKVRKVRGGITQLFTVYHENFSLIKVENDEIFNEGRKNIVTYNSRVENWVELEREEPLNVLIPHRVYKDLAELRFWIDSIITKHWSLECQKYMEDGPNSFNYGAFFSVLSRDFGERPQLTPYQELYRDMDVVDFYTGEPIKKLEIDHFLPWSRLPVNKFWNLVPTNKKINQKKSDRLIELNDYIRYEALPRHINRCISQDNPLVKNELQSTYQKYFKKPVNETDDKKTSHLTELVLNLYDSLDQVTVEDKLDMSKLAS